MCGTIKRTLINKTRKDTQLKFYKVMTVPVLLYGCENWALNTVDRRNIETAEMKSAVFWVVAPCSRPDDGGSKDL
jgi:hypothetical protein